MPSVTIEPFETYGWAGHRINCGPLKLVLVPAIGGRIMSVRYEGRELLYHDPQHAGQTFDVAAMADLEAAKKEMGFRVWGGDKTWVAPQYEWALGIPPLDLDAAPYELTWEDKTAVMTSPVCRETGLRIVRKVMADNEGTVHLTEEMHNASDKEIRKGIWNVTQVMRPCEFFIPANKGSIRSYHHEDRTLPEIDTKGLMTEAEGWVEIPCRQALLFKFGGIPREGNVMVKMPLGGPRQVVWLKAFELDPHATFAHRSAVEIFNSDKLGYAELELHAPVAVLAPGARSSFKQQWRFKKL